MRYDACFPPVSYPGLLYRTRGHGGLLLCADTVSAVL